MSESIVPDIASPPLARPRRWLSIALGLVFVGLGALGVFLPVLPTTPFLILASACFVRSSPWLNAWLLNSPIFGPLLRDWQRHRRVRRRVKHLSAALLIMAVALSVWLGQLSSPWLIVVLVLALIGLAVVMRLPERSPTTASDLDSPSTEVQLLGEQPADFK